MGPRSRRGVEEEEFSCPYQPYKPPPESPEDTAAVALLRPARRPSKPTGHAPTALLSVVVWGGVVIFLGVVTFVLVATQGHLGRLLANETPANYVYVMLMQLTLLIWLIAVVFRVLEMYKIPYNEVLEPSPPTALVQRTGDRSAYQTAAIAAAFSVTTAASIGVYLSLCWDEAHDRARDCASGSPIAVEFGGFAAVFVLVCLPWPLPMWKARKRLIWRLIQSFGCVLGRPLCGALEFVHTVVTDTLTSTCLLLWQFEFSVCLFATGNWVHGEGQDSGEGQQCVSPDSFNRSILKPLIIALPFWLRFCQASYLAWCGDGMQFWNALKYCSALAVVFTSAATDWDRANYQAWHIAWIVSLVVKTIYCYSWDVRVDWGLLEGSKSNRGSATFWRGRSEGRNLLRPTIFFDPWIYYFALVFNLFGRVAWSIAISPAFCSADCVLGLGLLEMIRRALWILLRLENAYIRLDTPIFTELEQISPTRTA